MRVQRRISTILLYALLVFVVAFPARAAGAAEAAAVAADSRGSSTQSVWLSSVQEGLRQAEYQITWQAGGAPAEEPASFQAPNRAQHFRTYFTGEGILVTSRQADHPAAPGAGWEWGLRLSAWGSGDRLFSVGEPVATNVAGNRFEYEYESAIREWYVNDERGLEQGFSLEAPPPGAVDLPLILEMAVAGNLLAQGASDGRSIDFLTAGGVGVLRYSDLHVFDAIGKEIPASLQLAENGRVLRVVVDQAQAVYPIMVDPLATSPSWTAESNQGGAQFGLSVASAGDFNGDGYDDVAVGAPLYDNGQADEGAVMIFFGSASGLDSSSAWGVEGGAVGAHLGQSVDSAGDVNSDGYADLITGAPGAGTVNLYFGGATPDENADWSDTGSGSFGFSVASAGDVNQDGYADVIVGAYQAGVGGQVFVYHGSGSGLSASPNWQAEAGQAGADFGFSVSGAGDVNGDGFGDVISGSPKYDAPLEDEGAAFVWFGAGGGVNSGTAGTPGNADWRAEGEAAGVFLGSDASRAGDVNGDGYGDVLVGAPGYGNEQAGEGGVFIWHGSGSGLHGGINGTPTEVDRALEGGTAGAGAGSQARLAGDVNGDGYADIIFGAPGTNSAYVHFGSSTGAAATANWTGTGTGNYGAAVGTAGDVNGDGYAEILVGAPLYASGGGQEEEGQAAMFLGGSSGLSAASDWLYQPGVADAMVGFSVSTAGDVNGDGYDDVIVGAWTFDNDLDQHEEGAVFVFYGSAAGLSSTPDWMAESNQSGARLGSAVSTAGDVNGDGYSDIIAGARAFNNPENEEGLAFVWYGSSSGLVGQPGNLLGAAWVGQSNQADAWFGDSVASAGDVNGDGYDDIVVGASRYDHPEINEGTFFVWYGSSSGLAANGSPANASWMAESNQEAASNANMLTLGSPAESAGDVNGDGYDDLLLGWSRFDGTQLDDGVAGAWYGSANGLGANGSPDNADWFAVSNQRAAFLGAWLDSAGDVNGDGYDDVIISADHYDNPQVGEGMAYVWHGSAAGINNGVPGDPANRAWSVEGNLGTIFYGSAVGAAGDVNGDGYGDVFVGTAFFDSGDIPDTGIMDIYHGSASGLNPTYAWRGTGNGASGDAYGRTAHWAGDVNGDGYDDFIVAEHSFDGGLVNQGRVYFYYGNGWAGKAILPRQRRADDTAWVLDGGQAISPTQARISLLARSPLGGSSVRMEWEIKPYGVAFDGTGLGQSDWENSGIAGYSFNQLIDGLTFEAKYHWRVRFLARPYNAGINGAPFYRSRWIEGSTFFTALSGTQVVNPGSPTSLLERSSYVNVPAGQQGSLTTLVLRGYPDTAHPMENIRSGGENILNRYYSVTPNEGASGYSLTMCLAYTESEAAGLNENLLRLCRWTGSSWSCSNRGTNSSTTNNLVCADNVTQLSDWVIGQVGPTDVSLVQFQTTSGGLFSPGIMNALFAGLVMSLLGLVWLGLRAKK